MLNPLDRLIFGNWLAGSTHPVHLLGASIGSWRMATACLDDPAAAFAQMADDYIHQHYDHAPGKAPKASHVGEVFGAKLAERFGGREAQVLAHPRYRLHVFTSRGRHLLGREGRLRTPLGYLGAFATNAVSRKAMGGWLERVIFSDAREPLPLHLHDFRTHVVPLRADNLQPSLLASCSIPFWLQAVHDIPGGPRGAYWDGGITDYHLHLNYASMDTGLVLYPHFQKTVIPGWLDKALRHRHVARPSTWTTSSCSLRRARPGSPACRAPSCPTAATSSASATTSRRAWRQQSTAVRESERLADEFAHGARSWARSRLQAALV